MLDEPLFYCKFEYPCRLLDVNGIDACGINPKQDVRRFGDNGSRKCGDLVP